MPGAVVGGGAASLPLPTLSHTAPPAATGPAPAGPAKLLLQVHHQPDTALSWGGLLQPVQQGQAAAGAHLQQEEEWWL